MVTHPINYALYCRLVSAYEDKILYTNKLDLTYVKLSKRLGVNFTKFVDYVLKSGRGCIMGDNCSKIDGHWEPYHSR